MLIKLDIQATTLLLDEHKEKKIKVIIMKVLLENKMPRLILTIQKTKIR